MKLFISILCTAAFFFHLNTANADSVSKPQLDGLLANPATVWKNESGSYAYLTFTPSTVSPNVWDVTGHYVNNAQGFSCQGSPYPVTGTLYGNNLTISFNVAWSNSKEDCQSVTGWTGYIIAGTVGYTMTTNWNLAYYSGTSPQIEAGSDQFFLQSTATTSSLKAQ